VSDPALVPAAAPAAHAWRTVPVLVGRGVRLSVRTVDALLTTLILPVVLMLLFVYLFGGALVTGADHYVTYVVPGVLVLCAGFGSSVTAVAVCNDLHDGLVDRLRSLDVKGPAVLSGHVAASLLRNLVSTVLVLGVAFAVGFRPHASVAGWLAALGMVTAFVLAISWAAAAVGLFAGSAEAANGFTFVLMFLPYASSAFVPLHTMPGWLQAFSAHQPVTPVVESLRGFLLGTPTGDNPWLALAWCAGLAAAGVAVTAWGFSRRTR
jgi:ABC-2 type transport system permease protein